MSDDVRLTAEFLASLGACEDVVAEFHMIWPEGLELTERNFYIAHYEEKFDVWWILDRMREYWPDKAFPFPRNAPGSIYEIQDFLSDLHNFIIEKGKKDVQDG